MDDLKPITYGEWIHDLVTVALGAGAICLLIGLLIGYYLRRREQMSHETYKPAKTSEDYTGRRPLAIRRDPE